MIRTLILSASLGLATLAAHAADPTTKLTVNGMVCAFCAQGIEKRLGALPATQAVYVNLGQKIVAVEPRPGHTIDVEQVRAEVKEAGYDVVKVESVPESIEQMRAAAKAKKK